MNQAGMLMDINITPAANIYPTSRGGTSTGAAAALNPTTNSAVATDPSTGATTVSTDTPTPGSKKTVWYWVGLVALLLLLVFAARKAGSEEDFRNIRPTFYNFLAITLTAIVGITGMKVIATKFRVPGASDVILAA